MASATSSSRFQFSLAGLLLAMLLVGAACLAFRWLGTLWSVPLSLASLSIVNLLLAVRRGSDWRMLKLGHWHLALWLAVASTASALAIRGCESYNEVAGTDKTPWHMIQISAAVLTGPMVGPVANSGAGAPAIAMAWQWSAILLVILLVATSPFLFVRRQVPVILALLCWATFLGATVLWFFGAMISMGVFLS